MIEEELNKLECHFTWDLRKEDADLNYLMIKFTENLLVQTDRGGHFRKRELHLSAYIYHLLGFSDKAHEYLEKVEEAQNDHSCNIVTYGNLAWLHHHMADDTMAKVYLGKLAQIPGAIPTATEKIPREVLSEKAWSFLRFSKKHYIRAKEIFQEAVQKEPVDKEWNTGYAFALFHLEGLEIRKDKRMPFEESLAVSQLKRALKLDPDNAMIHVFMGLKCYRNQSNAEAWEHIKQALDMAPYDLSVVLRVAKFMKKEQCYDMALGVLKKVLEKAPDSSRLHHEIAKNYRWKAMQLKDTHNPRLLSLCIHHLEEGARLNPDFVYPQIELALRYAEVGNFVNAKQKFQELFARPNLQPADLQAWHRIYGDFNMYRLGAEATAVMHYKKGMALQKVSTEWTICKNRLYKVLSYNSRKKDVYQIQEFMNSLREITERTETSFFFSKR